MSQKFSELTPNEKVAKVEFHAEYWREQLHLAKENLSWLRKNLPDKKGLIDYAEESINRAKEMIGKWETMANKYRSYAEEQD